MTPFTWALIIITPFGQINIPTRHDVTPYLSFRTYDKCQSAAAVMRDVLSLQNVNATPVCLPSMFKED